MAGRPRPTFMKDGVKPSFSTRRSWPDCSRRVLDFSVLKPLLWVQTTETEKPINSFSMSVSNPTAYSPYAIVYKTTPIATRRQSQGSLLYLDSAEDWHRPAEGVWRSVYKTREGWKGPSCFRGTLKGTKRILLDKRKGLSYRPL